MGKYWCSFLLRFLVMMVYCGGHWTSAQNCPDGYFGSNCTFKCHCQNGDSVCKVKGCVDFKCDFGWTRAPGCQERCSPNKYGLNCFFHCHCPVNDKCDYKNGNCPSQRCHPEWYGAGCQQRLARLFRPPTINVYGCQNLTVSWKAWTYNVDVGVTDISAYILKIRRQGNQEWQDIVITNEGPNFNVNVPGLVKNGVYQFRVDILSKNEKSNITGPPGVPTHFVHVPCIKPNVIQAITTDAQGQITVQLADKVSGKISYTEKGTGDCLKIDGPIKTQDFQDAEKVTLTTLPWKRYLVTIEIFPPYNIKYVQSILTAETVPTGKVTNIRIDRVTFDSVSLSWTSPNCPERGGVFVRFDVILTPSNDSSAPIVETNTTKEMITIEKLEAFTTYSVEVAFVNGGGRGEMSDKVEFKTKESVPDRPKIVKIESSTNTLTVTWEPMENPHNHIQEYQLICSGDDNFYRSISITKSAQETTNASFLNMKPFTDYYIKIQARTSVGWGQFSSSQKIKTKEGPPSAPKQIQWVHGNMTCLTLAWSPSENLNGILKYYIISRTEIFSYSKIKQESNTTKRKIKNIPKYEMCGLLPATEYRFTIRAATGGGQGPGSESATFWTEILPPAAPPSPKIANRSYSSVDITLQPVVTYTGPVSLYEIRVEVLPTENGVSPNKRKKRNVQETSLEHRSTLTAVLTPQQIGYSTVFTVGDNKTYGSVRNKPLSNRELYRIHYVVYSSFNNVSKLNASSTPPFYLLSEDKKQETIPLVPWLLAVLVLVLLLVVLLIALFLYRKGWNRKHPYVAHVTKSVQWTDDEVLEKHWNATYSNHQRRFIVVNKDFLPTKPLPSLNSGHSNEPFNFFLKQRLPAKQQTQSPSRKNNVDPVTFRKEFDTLNELPRTRFTYNEATKIENTKLNRFSHLLPYDHSRVRLEPDSSSTNTYINANIIKIPGYNNTMTTVNRTYIAAQSPFNTETMRDFWRIIYQQQVRVVVMLTKNVEDKIIKCSEYFPKIVGQSFTFEQFIMRVINVDSHVDFSITEIMLELFGGKQWNLYVFRLFDWPEKRVVGYSLPLLDMRRKVRQCSDNFPHSPILVHCGTGNGRTGTFIAIDSLLDEYYQHGSVSVFNHVKCMRDCRSYMVRTFAQYLLIYDVIFEACQAGTISFVTLSDFDAKLKQLNLTNSKTSRTYLEDQFTLLGFLTPKPNTDQIRTGLLPENSGKHRYPDIIPPDEFRPRLTNLYCKNSSDSVLPMYINAVLIDGYKRKGGYIVTQTPLPNSLEEFWCLIYEYEVRTIVMMDTNTKGDTCISYWKHQKSFKCFTVTPEGQTVNDWFTVHRLVLKRKDATVEEAPKVVQLYRFKSWKNPYFVPVGRDCMLDLIVEVNKWQKENQQRPIVVHCKDGATNSGLFCASDSLVQEMINEKSTDVYYTLKKMKIRRPEMIPNVEQYKFCHSVIQLYVSRHKQ